MPQPVQHPNGRQEPALDALPPSIGGGPSVVVVMLTVAGALVGASLPVFLLSALAPSVQIDLGFGEAGLGVAVAAFFLAAALSSVPGGRFADRFGAAISLRTGLLVAATGSVGVAFLARSSGSLVIGMFVAGASLGFVDTGGARAIAAAVPVTRQGLAFGVKEASIPTASFLAGASVPVLGARFGWRVAFIAGAAAAMAIAAAVSSRLEVTGERRHGRSMDTSMATDRMAASIEPMAASAASTRPLLLLSVTAALGGGAAAATTAFLVASSVAGGWSPAAAGGLLAGASLTAVAVRLLTGQVVDRRNISPVPLVASMLIVGAVGVSGLAFGAAIDAASTTLTAMVVIFGAIIGVGAGWGWTGLVFLAAVRLDPARPAKAAGIVLAGLGIGGTTSPAVFGWVAGQAGYTKAWSAAVGAMSIAAVTALVAARMARKAPSAP